MVATGYLEAVCGCSVVYPTAGPAPVMAPCCSLGTPVLSGHCSSEFNTPSPILPQVPNTHEGFVPNVPLCLALKSLTCLLAPRIEQSCLHFIFCSQLIDPKAVLPHLKTSVPSVPEPNGCFSPYLCTFICSSYIHSFIKINFCWNTGALQGCVNL